MVATSPDALNVSGICPRCRTPLSDHSVVPVRDTLACALCGDIIPPGDLDWLEPQKVNASLHASVQRPTSKLLLHTLGGIAFFMYLARQEAPGLHLLMGLLFFGIVFGYVFAILKAWLNRWRFSFDRESLKIWAGPILQKGALSCTTPEVAGFDVLPGSPKERFYFTEVRLEKKTLPEGWDLAVLMRDGSIKRIPIALPQRSHASFIANKLNATLAETHRAPETIDYRGERIAPEQDELPSETEGEEESVRSVKR